jgi:glyoxylase-like metal-dependent hydrolase (beta-lactamase superfamily II)
VLFTHHRRDAVWAGEPLVRKGAQAVAPEAERDLFENVDQFWTRYQTERFHDYANQSSRILTEPLPLARTVKEGDRIEWQDLAIQVLDTPGYTRGAVSYLFTVDGKRIACVGDLIYGNGQILDLFSLQDKIPEASEDGYHGYAARAGQVVASLRKIAAQHPDLLIPARGPVIRNPDAAIRALIQKLQNVFKNHFEIDALRWYRGDEKIRIMAGRVLAPEPVTWMPMAETQPLPQWVIPITNSRLIVSSTGAAFLVDCGNRQVVETVERFEREGKIKHLDGIYITHYHDDHTDMAQKLADEFHCPIYATEQMRDILEHPGAYRMPCLTANAIHPVKAMPSGSVEHWNEFTFTYSYFPGQTLFHGGLLAARETGEKIFFVGDSFTPSGLDDYCLLNRNFIPPEEGFARCLKDIKQMQGDYVLVNQHVLPTFRFSPGQLERMENAVAARRSLLSDLFPFDDPNFGLDEQWARFYPYAADVSPGQDVTLQFIVRNHSAHRQRFTITPHAPASWAISKPSEVSVGSRQEASIHVQVHVPPTAQGLSLVTADVAFDGKTLKQWTEALLTAKP